MRKTKNTVTTEEDMIANFDVKSVFTRVPLTDRDTFSQRNSQTSSSTAYKPATSDTIETSARKGRKIHGLTTITRNS